MDIEISILTYKDSRFEVVFRDESGNEIILVGEQVLSDDDFELVSRIAPPCVFTKYSQNAEQFELSTMDPFEQFWQAFPPTRRRSKGAARKAFEKAVKKCPAKEIIWNAGEYAKSVEGQSEFCQGPAPWLNQERWADHHEAWNRGEDPKPKTFEQSRVSGNVAASNWRKGSQGRIE